VRYRLSVLTKGQDRGARGVASPGRTERFTWFSESRSERPIAESKAGSQEQEPEQDASD
jgi:hypothetical protein